MATTAQQVAELQKQNNEMYIQSAREQMAFQERMSNSAHVREVKDLLNAGLNPVLSATGGQGATTPNGAQADVDSSSMVNFLLNEMNNENARAMNNAQVSAQKYAAEMAYKSAQVAANAQIRAAELNNLNSIPGWIGTALSDPKSPQGVALDKFLGLFGTSLNELLGATQQGIDQGVDVIKGPKNITVNSKTGSVDLSSVFNMPYVKSSDFSNKFVQGLYKVFPKARARDFLDLVNRLNLWQYGNLRNSLRIYYHKMGFYIPKYYQ